MLRVEEYQEIRRHGRRLLIAIGGIPGSGRLSLDLGYMDI
jgi:hypothetical protein